MNAIIYNDRTESSQGSFLLRTHYITTQKLDKKFFEQFCSGAFGQGLGITVDYFLLEGFDACRVGQNQRE